MSEPTRLPPSVLRRIPTEFGGVKEQILQQLGVDQVDTGGIDPLADNLLEKADYLEALKEMGLPPGKDARSLYRRRRRKLLYRFVVPRENELSEPSGSTDEVRAYERRVPVRLTPEENATLVEQVKEELRSPNASTYLGDPLTAGAVRYDSRLGIPQASGPILGPEAESNQPPSASDGNLTPSRPMRPDDSFGTPETHINLSSTESERVSVFRTASVPQTPSSGHNYSMSIRPGETKTQRIELPGLTLDLAISMPA